MQLPVKLLRDGAQAPRYMTEAAAGMDLFACPEQPVVIRPGERVLVGTGVAIELPAGYEGQVRPRSGLALKHGVTVLNAPGTIDADYRGEVKVLLVNHGQADFPVAVGDRIAQLVVAPVTTVTPTLVDDLSSTTRGAGGYGHTGR